MRARAALAWGLVCALVVGCASTDAALPPATSPSATVSPAAAASVSSQPGSAPASASPTPVTPASAPSPSSTSETNEDELVLAFAGDSNAFEGGGESIQKGLGEAGKLLASADLASVNLETALADDASGLQKQPKLYTFLTGSAFPRMLAREGIDVVSMANNHAMDFGPEGMRRTLAIKQHLTAELPMVGIGATEQEAFAPVVRRVKGRTVIIHAGNDILESNMDWSPRPGRPGVAMVKTPEHFERLLAGIRASRQAHPEAVVVVWMHWGIDYQVCTQQDRQEQRARRLAEAGATVVVGSHAHRVQRIETIGQTLVAHGLGNFNFSSDRVETRETGVLTVTVPRTGSPRAQWAPGRIVDGRPVLLTGAQKQDALVRHQGLPGGC